MSLNTSPPSNSRQRSPFSWSLAAQFRWNIPCLIQCACFVAISATFLFYLGKITQTFNSSYVKLDFRQRLEYDLPTLSLCVPFIDALRLCNLFRFGPEHKSCSQYNYECNAYASQAIGAERLLNGSFECNMFRSIQVLRATQVQTSRTPYLVFGLYCERIEFRKKTLKLVLPHMGDKVEHLDRQQAMQSLSTIRFAPSFELHFHIPKTRSMLLHLFVHTHNQLPQRSNQYMLRDLITKDWLRNSYIISYTRIQVELINNGMSRNCRHYKVGDNRIRCFERCMHNVVGSQYYRYLYTNRNVPSGFLQMDIESNKVNGNVSLSNVKNSCTYCMMECKRFFFLLRRRVHDQQTNETHTKILIDEDSYVYVYAAEPWMSNRLFVLYVCNLFTIFFGLNALDLLERVRALLSHLRKLIRPCCFCLGSVDPLPATHSSPPSAPTASRRPMQRPLSPSPPAASSQLFALPFLLFSRNRSLSNACLVFGVLCAMQLGDVLHLYYSRPTLTQSQHLIGHSVDSLAISVCFSFESIMAQAVRDVPHLIDLPLSWIELHQIVGFNFSQMSRPALLFNNHTWILKLIQFNQMMTQKLTEGYLSLDLHYSYEKLRNRLQKRPEYAANYYLHQHKLLSERILRLHLSTLVDSLDLRFWLKLTSWAALMKTSLEFIGGFQIAYNAVDRNQPADLFIFHRHVCNRITSTSTHLPIAQIQDPDLRRLFALKCVLFIKHMRIPYDFYMLTPFDQYPDHSSYRFHQNSRFRIVRVQKLPAPFSNDCVDYRRTFGCSSRNFCIERCVSKQFYEKYQLYPDTISLLPSELPIHSQDKFLGIYSKANTDVLFRLCQAKYPNPDCDRIWYMPVSDQEQTFMIRPTLFRTIHRAPEDYPNLKTTFFIDHQSRLNYNKLIIDSVIANASQTDGFDFDANRRLKLHLYHAIISNRTFPMLEWYDLVVHIISILYLWYGLSVKTMLNWATDWMLRSSPFSRCIRHLLQVLLFTFMLLQTHYHFKLYFRNETLVSVLTQTTTKLEPPLMSICFRLDALLPKHVLQRHSLSRVELDTIRLLNHTELFKLSANLPDIFHRVTYRDDRLKKRSANFSNLENKLVLIENNLFVIPFIYLQMKCFSFVVSFYNGTLGNVHTTRTVLRLELRKDWKELSIYFNPKFELLMDYSMRLKPSRNYALTYFQTTRFDRSKSNYDKCQQTPSMFQLFGNLKQFFCTLKPYRNSFSTTLLPLGIGWLLHHPCPIRNDLFFVEMIRFDKLHLRRKEKLTQCVQYSYRVQAISSGSTALLAFSNESYRANSATSTPIPDDNKNPPSTLPKFGKVITLNPSLIEMKIEVQPKMSFVEFLVFLGNVIAFWMDVNFADVLAQSVAYIFRLRVLWQTVLFMHNPRKHARLRSRRTLTDMQLSSVQRQGHTERSLATMFRRSRADNRTAPLSLVKGTIAPRKRPALITSGWIQTDVSVGRLIVTSNSNAASILSNGPTIVRQSVNRSRESFRSYG